MRAGCVWIGRFRLGVEGGSRADLQDRPVVLGGEPWERRGVLDCSPEAERSGVRAGNARFPASVQPWRQDLGGRSGMRS